jgi:hypothetical protein
LTEFGIRVYNPASFFSLIAQLVERRTVNPQVPGSSPGRGAKRIKQKAQPTRLGFLFSEFRATAP